MIHGISNHQLWNQPYCRRLLTTLKYTTSHIGNHGELKSKNHIHHCQCKNHLWHSHNDPCGVLIAGQSNKPLIRVVNSVRTAAAQSRAAPNRNEAAFALCFSIAAVTPTFAAGIAGFHRHSGHYLHAAAKFGFFIFTLLFPLLFFLQFYPLNSPNIYFALFNSSNLYFVLSLSLQIYYLPSNSVNVHFTLYDDTTIADFILLKNKIISY